MCIFCFKWFKFNSFWFTEGFDWGEWVKLEKSYKFNVWIFFFFKVYRAEISIVCLYDELSGTAEVLSVNEPPVQCYRKQKKYSLQRYTIVCVQKKKKKQEKEKKSVYFLVTG